ncbi:unnamed protein product [Cochlearia groenlandica]
MTGCASLVHQGTQQEEETQQAKEPKHDNDVGGNEKEDEEDDLFEINLEAVSDTKPSPPSWQRSPARTGSVLLANCLLPAAEISCAVPATTRAWSDLVWFRGCLYVQNLGTENKLNYL